MRCCEANANAMLWCCARCVNDDETMTGGPRAFGMSRDGQKKQTTLVAPYISCTRLHTATKYMCIKYFTLSASTRQIVAYCTVRHVYTRFYAVRIAAPMTANNSSTMATASSRNNVRTSLPWRCTRGANRNLWLHCVSRCCVGAHTPD